MEKPVNTEGTRIQRFGKMEVGNQWGAGTFEERVRAAQFCKEMKKENFRGRRHVQRWWEEHLC